MPLDASVVLLNNTLLSWKLLVTYCTKLTSMMAASNQAEVKARLFDEFIPLDIEASVIELIIDESNFNEDESRRHLRAMVASSSVSRTSPPQVGANTTSSAGNNPRSPAARPNGATRVYYSSAAARAPAAPIPRVPRRLPPPAALAQDGVTSTSLQQKLSAGVPLMILMRGLPGSGKSTLSKQLAGPSGVVVSADDFFVTPRGEYVFRAERLTEAHEWCRQQARRALTSGRTPVVVDNTNTEAWEMRPYLLLAAEHDYYVELAEPTTPWRREPRQLARRSVHGVPERTIERMLARFQTLNVSTLYRLIGKEPKPWPPVEQPARRNKSPAQHNNTPPAATTANAVQPMDTKASLERSRAAVNSVPAPASSQATAAAPAPAAVPAPAPVPAAATASTQASAPVSVVTPAAVPARASPPAAAPAPSPPSADSKEITMADMSAALEQLNWSRMGAAATERVWSAEDTDADRGAVAAPPPATADASAQTGGGGGRSVSPRPWRGVSVTEDGPPPLVVPLHRGTMTSPPPETVDSKLEGLSDLFPSVSAANLRHILDQCNGNVEWAINVLLDTDLDALAPADDDDGPAPAEAAAEEEGGMTAAGPEPTDLPSLPLGLGARPKQRLPPPLVRQTSSDSGPDVIVEDSSGSDEDAPPPPAGRRPSPAAYAAAAVAAAASSSSSSTSGSSPPTPRARRRAASAAELKLQMPPRLLFQLQELFGPTKFGVRSEAELSDLPAADLTVHLPLEVARMLHQCWAAGADRAFDEEQRSFDQLSADLKRLQRQEEEERKQAEEERNALLRNDEEIARQLQLEEDGQGGGVGGSAVSPTPQLRQIMAEQQAVQRSEQAQNSGTPATQADRLTRQRLREEFPGVDARYLEDLLDMHDGDYRQVLRVLQGTRGERPRRTAAIRAPPSPPPPPVSTAAAGGAAGRLPADFLTEDGLPSFHDIRAESELIRQKINHAKMMAERAVRRGDYSVSQYYVNERERLYQDLSECNMRATIVTMELRQDPMDPNRIDLHHLFVDDAREQLASFIADRQNYFGRNGIRSKNVEIITGKGKNSKHGKPRIKPAVEQWLQNKGFQFREAEGNSGMLVVTVHSEHLYRPLN